MNAHSESNTRLRGRWLVLARAVWIALVIMSLTLFVASLPIVFNQLLSVSSAQGTEIWQLSPEGAHALERLGLSLGFYAAYFIVIQVGFVLGFAIVAGVIFWRRSDDWMALFVSLFLVMFGANWVTAVPVPTTILQAIQYLLFKIVQDVVFISFPLFFFLFPDGQFVPRWTRLLAVGWITFGLIKRLLLFSPPASGDLILLGLLGIGALAQIYRYRRVSTIVQRQQTKWAVFGFVITILVFAGVQLVFVLVPGLTKPGAALYRVPALTIILLSLLVLPVTIGISILRYRLFDVDILIRRTLVYGVLTGLLAFVYFGGVVLLQQLFRAPEQSEIVTVISTLAIAALFAPLRRRVQAGIDRRFYRRKYDAAKMLAAFSATVRDEVDLNKLTDQLLAVVEETMQPAHVSLWLKEFNAKARRRGDAKEI